MRYGRHGDFGVFSAAVGDIVHGAVSDDFRKFRRKPFMRHITKKMPRYVVLKALQIFVKVFSDIVADDLLYAINKRVGIEVVAV